MPGQGSQVGVTVKSDLLRVVEDLKKIAEEAGKVSDQLKQTGSSVGKEVENQTRTVRSGLERMKNFGKSVAKSLKDDFKSLFALNAVSGSLKLSEQFKGSIKESVTLGDTIRRLGANFGIASDRFSSFQARITKGLGQIGLSSEVATRSLEGLAETPVRGEENLMAYSKMAGQLASISGTQGQEGNIAKGIANILQARGANPNDVKAAAQVAEDLRRVQNATGRKPGETIGAMTQLFTGMDKAMRQKISTRGLSNLAATGSIAGPNSTKFLEEFLQAGSIGRMRFEAQGFKDVFTDQGIDVEKFRSAGAGIMGRIAQDPRMAAQTLGISEEAAEGFVRLYESLDRVKAAQDAVRTSTGDLEKQYLETRSMGDSFRSSINRVKSMVAGPLSEAGQGFTKLLGKASESDLGAAGVVGGAGVAAALLAGFGLKGVGKGMLGGLVKEAAVEGVTGEDVQKVMVINWPAGMSVPGAAGAAGALGKAAKFAGGAVGVLGAGAAGYEIGSAINDVIDSKTQGTTSEGFQGNAIERLIFKIDKLIGGENAQRFMHGGGKQAVQVEIKSKDVRQIPSPGRGR